MKTNLTYEDFKLAIAGSNKISRAVALENAIALLSRVSLEHLNTALGYVQGYYGISDNGIDNKGIV